MKSYPSPELLRRLLRYEPETGKLYWLERTSDVDARFRQFNSQFAGKEALYGASSSNGYCTGAIFNRQYLAHRVIWVIVYGEWPDNIDHINGCRTDNRIINLRSVNKAQNAQNMAKSRRNKSGAIGVYWAKHAGKWRAEISANGKRAHLGYFDTINDAQFARLDAQLRLGFHSNHGRVA